MKQVFHILMIQGCTCDNDCGGTEMQYEGDLKHPGWTESIVHAKEYDSYEKAVQAIDDYIAFFSHSKVPMWFHIDKMFRP